MQIEVDLGAGLDQASRVRRKDVAVLAERVLVEEESDGIFFRILDEVRREVMHDLEALRIGRLALDRHHVHVFGEARVDEHVHDVVGPIFRKDVRLVQRHDDVGLADEPGIEIAELARLGHVGRVAHGRSGVHPCRNGGDL